MPAKVREPATTLSDLRCRIDRRCRSRKYVFIRYATERSAAVPAAVRRASSPAALKARRPFGKLR